MHTPPTPKAPRAGLRRTALTALACLALGSAQAQPSPSMSLAEQMRAMLGKPSTGATAGATAGAPTGAPMGSPPAPATGSATVTPPSAAATAAPPQAAGAGPLRAEGPPQLRQSAAALAQPFPAAQRAAMSKAFEESFGFWQKLETQLGLAPDDLAAGVAAFIAGNYAVFMQQQVSDEQFKTLVRQMQGLLGQSAGIRQAGAAQRRALYEQMAMVGTFMVVYREQLKAKPNASEELNFRNTAKANLEAALGVGVERILIGAQGLEIR